MNKWLCFCMLFLGIHNVLAQEGRLIKQVIDYPDNTSTISYLLELPSKQLKSLHLDRKAMQLFEKNKYATGDIIQVEGKESIKGISVQGYTLLKKAPPRLPSYVGSYKAIVFIANFTDFKSSFLWNEAFISPHLAEIKKAYTQSSRGQFDWDFSYDGQENVAQVLELPITKTCTTTTLVNAVRTAASAKGINLSQYDSMVIVLGRNSTFSCSWLGIAPVDCMKGAKGSCWAIQNAPGSLSLAHELGHNLGLNHARTPDSSYGDLTCIMGGASLNASNYRLFNATKPYYLGWANQLPNNFRLDPGPGVYELFPLQKDLNEHPDLTLAVSQAGIVASLRQAQGFDVQLTPELIKGIAIHDNSTSSSLLLTVLTPGQSYTKNGYTFTHLDTGSYSYSAQLKIEYNCQKKDPSLVKAFDDVGVTTPDTWISRSFKITNNDSANCPAREFGPEFSSTGIMLKAALEPQLLAPGETRTMVADFKALQPGFYSYRWSIPGLDNPVPRILEDSIYAGNQPITFDGSVWLDHTPLAPYSYGSYAPAPVYGTSLPKEQFVRQGITQQPVSYQEIAMHYHSLLKITESKAYTFYLNSMNGSSLYLKSTLLINKPASGLSEKKATINLEPGIYELEVNSARTGNWNNLSVQIEAEGLPKQTIPPTMLGFLPGYLPSPIVTGLNPQLMVLLTADNQNLKLSTKSYSHNTPALTSWSILGGEIPQALIANKAQSTQGLATQFILSTQLVELLIPGKYWYLFQIENTAGRVARSKTFVNIVPGVLKNM